MSQEEEKLLEKNITDLTPEDIDRLSDLYRETEGITAEFKEKLADSVLLLSAIEYSNELRLNNFIEGAKAALRALNEYAAAHKGKTAHDLFIDLNLPETLVEIRQRANAILAESFGQSGEPIKEEWQKKFDALKGEKLPLKPHALILHDAVTKSLLDRTQSSVDKKRALPALPKEGIVSYVKAVTQKGYVKEATEERVIDYGDLGYMVGYIRLYESDRRNKIFTPAMLYRAANGIEDYSDVSPKQEDEAREFMTRCAAQRIIIDKRKEYSHRLKIAKESGSEEDLKRLESIIGNPEKLGLISEPLLDFTEHIDEDLFKETGEIKAICYEPGREPALMQSAIISGQLKSVPAKALDIRNIEKDPDGKIIIGRRLRNSRERMNIKYYLLDAVRLRNGGQNWPITLEDIIKQGLPGHSTGKDGIPELTEKQRRQCREYVRDILTYWEAIGYIDKFRYVRGEDKFIINENEKKNKRKKTAISGH